MAVQAPERQKNEGKVREGIFDIDLHVYTRDGVRSIFPYLTKEWQKIFRHREVGLTNPLPPLRYAFPPTEDVSRADAAPPGGGPPGSDPDFVITDHLEPNNIAYAIMQPLQGALVNACTNADEAATLASGYNRYFADEWLALDDRFRLAMVVAPQDPLKAAEEIRRFGPTKGVAAVWLPFLNIRVGNRYYNPIYEACTDVGLPLLLHLSGAEGSYLGAGTFAGGIPSTYIERYCDFMHLGEASLTSLMFEGVFERFPTLKVFFTEFGWSWVPAVLWRMDMAWKALRIETPWVKKLPTEYVLEHVRFSSEPAEDPPNRDHLLQMAEMMYAHQTLCFSSDYPHWDADDPKAVFRTFPEDLKQRIFRQNALEALGDRLLS